MNFPFCARDEGIVSRFKYLYYVEYVKNLVIFIICY